MNNTYRPPGGRPPVGINTPMAPTPPNPLNRANQLMANERAQNATFKSGAYAGNPATATTGGAEAAGRQPNSPSSVSWAPGTQAPGMVPSAAQQTAMNAAAQQSLAELKIREQNLAQTRNVAPAAGGFGTGPAPTGGGIGTSSQNTQYNPTGGIVSGPAPSTGAVFRKGGNVKAYAKGGKVSSASSRGDGIASRGKTRGKMC